MSENVEEARLVVTEIKRLIADLPPHQQRVVGLVADDIRAKVSMHGDIGLLAITLVGAELQLQVEEQEQAV